MLVFYPISEDRIMTFSFDGYWLIKTDEDGNVQWDRTFESRTKLEYGRWYCELSSEEACRVFDFFNMKHTEYLFN
jgi:hypothetical protein